MSVRRATTADMTALEPLLQLMVRDADARPEPILADPNQFVALVEHAGTVVGYALLQDYGPSLRRTWSVARLHDMAVEPAHRGHGHGRELMDAVVAWARARGTVRYLEWQASSSAIGFYERLGHEPDRVGDFAEHPFFEIELSPRHER